MQKELSDQAKTAIAQELKASKQRIRIIELADPLYELGMVRFVNESGIFMYCTPTYREFVQLLAECKRVMHASGHKMSMKNYYMGADNDLAIVYGVSVRFDADEQLLAEVVMFCSESQRALDQVSGGKCIIQEEQTTKTDLQIACEVKHG